MKKLAPLFCFLALFVASCNTETAEKPTKPLLKSYSISKNAQGKYSIDYNLEKNVVSEFVTDEKTNTNQFYLFSDDNAVEKKFNKSLSLNRNELKVGFLEDNIQRNSVAIYDTNIILARGKEYNEYLESYSVTSVGDDGYKVEFKVKEGVVTRFNYNEEDKVHEIHLEKGTATSQTFLKEYKKSSRILKIDFVNHFKQETAARPGKRFSYTRGSGGSRVERRPRMIIQE